jgi:hypothetical protein
MRRWPTLVRVEMRDREKARRALAEYLIGHRDVCKHKGGMKARTDSRAVKEAGLSVNPPKHMN